MLKSATGGFQRSSYILVESATIPSICNKECSLYEKREKKNPTGFLKVQVIIQKSDKKWVGSDKIEYQAFRRIFRGPVFSRARTPPATMP